MGVTVLTNAEGLTGYWFAPDTPATPECNDGRAHGLTAGEGPAAAGPGVTANLGTIRGQLALSGPPATVHHFRPSGGEPSFTARAACVAC